MVHSLAILIRNVPMWMAPDLPLRSFNLKAKVLCTCYVTELNIAQDVLEFCESVLIYPTKDGPNEVNTIVLPPTIIRLHVKWSAADNDIVGDHTTIGGGTRNAVNLTGLLPRSISINQLIPKVDFITKNEVKVTVLGEPKVGYVLMDFYYIRTILVLMQATSCVV